MKDEEYIYRQEAREKASVSRSARSRRTHCGKGGRVKLPSDYMTKKELKAMNGEVEVYRLNSPMKWAEFKAMPDEHKVTYIKLLRSKWNAPDAQLATMFDISTWAVCQEMKRLGLSLGAKKGRSSWDKEGFMTWLYGVPKQEEVVEDTPTEEAVAEGIPEEQQMASLGVIAPLEPDRGEPKVVNHAIPHTGNLYFEGKIEDIMNAMSVLLAGARVGIGIKWDVLEVDDG